MKRRGFFQSILGATGSALVVKDLDAEESSPIKVEPGESINLDDFAYRQVFPCHAYSFGVHLDKHCDHYSKFVRKM